MPSGRPTCSSPGTTSNRPCGSSRSDRTPWASRSASRVPEDQTSDRTTRPCRRTGRKRTRSGPGRPPGAERRARHLGVDSAHVRQRRGAERRFGDRRPAGPAGRRAHHDVDQMEAMAGRHLPAFRSMVDQVEAREMDSGQRNRPEREDRRRRRTDRKPVGDHVAALRPIKVHLEAIGLPERRGRQRERKFPARPPAPSARCATADRNSCPAFSRCQVASSAERSVEGIAIGHIERDQRRPHGDHRLHVDRRIHHLPDMIVFGARVAEPIMIPLVLIAVMGPPDRGRRSAPARDRRPPGLPFPQMIPGYGPFPDLPHVRSRT